MSILLYFDSLQNACLGAQGTPLQMVFDCGMPISPFCSIYYIIIGSSFSMLPLMVDHNSYIGSVALFRIILYMRWESCHKLFIYEPINRDVRN